MNWFRSYLSGRQQRVRCSGILSSNIRNIKNGVPQGSILGSLLFLIYVNDFQNCLTSSNAIMFADDTSVYLQNRDIHKLFESGNEELKLVDNWLIANRLSVNIAKTKYVLFRSSNSRQFCSNFDLYLRHSKVEQVSSIKFLGVYINEHLSWSKHMNHLICKLRCVIGCVIKVKSLLNFKALLSIYHSLINSQLLYCISNWCFANKSLVNRLQQLCYKFLKIVFNLPNHSSICTFMKDNGLLNIEQLLIKELGVFMFKQSLNKNPAAFQDIFIKNYSKYKTRNKSNFVPKFCNMTVCQQSISYRAPNFWINAIPPHLKDLNQTAKTFSSKLKKSFLQ